MGREFVKYWELQSSSSLPMHLEHVSSLICPFLLDACSLRFSVQLLESVFVGPVVLSRGFSSGPGLLEFMDHCSTSSSQEYQHVPSWIQPELYKELV